MDVRLYLPFATRHRLVLSPPAEPLAPRRVDLTCEPGQRAAFGTAQLIPQERVQEPTRRSAYGQPSPGLWLLVT
jgi:hypothetical protein